MQIIDAIAIVDNAYSREYCEELIKIFEDNKHLHGAGGTYSGVNDDVKKATEVDFAPLFDFEGFTAPLNKIVLDYLETYTKDIDWNPLNLFSEDTRYNWCKVQKYYANDGHYISLHQERDGIKVCHDRLFVFMMYLNDVAEGGETNFPMQGLRIKPVCGTMLIWPASYPYIHNGEVPITENKYIITTWLEYNYGEGE